MNQKRCVGTHYAQTLGSQFAGSPYMLRSQKDSKAWAFTLRHPCARARPGCIVLCSGHVPGNVGIRKALRRCQQDARRRRSEVIAEVPPATLAAGVRRDPDVCVIMEAPRKRGACARAVVRR